MFNVGSPVKGKNFIDRVKHIPIFKAYLDANQHVMIKAPRRFGKTSLIKHVFEDNKNYKFIYTDIRRATSLNSLSNQILDKAYAFIGVDNFIYKSKESLIGLLKTIQGIKFGDMAQITLEYIEMDSDDVELFLHALDVVNKIAIKMDINLKFIFDEFQDIFKIADKNILEQLRSAIQHHSNVTYIFLGSIESMMTQIFEDKKSPFFHFTRIMPLGGLDTNELCEYIFDEFNKKNIKFEKKAIRLTITFLDGHPDYSMQVFQSIYFKAIIDKDIIDNDLCIKILKSVIMENRAYLDELIQKTKTKKHLHELLSSIANNDVSKLEAKTLYNAHMSLEDMGLIRNLSRGSYEVVDVFLNVLLKQNNNSVLIGEDIELSFINK
ncbi:MAG: hypothetical protein COB17_01555 [Sulfurimonas sp.]|nr:MAG: hypothetical protein COB17_01555 [Sulfurimonas sp.]